MKKKTVDSLKQNQQGIGFYVRENIARCVFVRQIFICPTKNLARQIAGGIHSEVVNPKIKTHEK